MDPNDDCSAKAWDGQASESVAPSAPTYAGAMAMDEHQESSDNYNLVPFQAPLQAHIL